MIQLIAPDLIQIDLFCGAGGVTLGTDKAQVDGKKVCQTIAAVNHNWKAIKSHWGNHKDVVHYEEDVRSLSHQLEGLKILLDAYRRLYPSAKVILWASLPCPHFSKAKGGGRKRSDMRTLAWALCKQYNSKTRRFYVGDSYIQVLRPDYLHIENVEEFATWGPLTPQGTVIKERKGEYFRAWCNYIKRLGYSMDWRKINAADLGGYTKRTRLFGCFAKEGLPIAWPEATHSKEGNMFTKKWKPVKEVLDFSDEGQSIFPMPGGRKKYMSLKTYGRILPGCIKFVPTDTSRGQFLLKYNSTNGKTGKHIPPSIEEPAPVISTQGRIGMVTPIGFLIKYHGNNGEGALPESWDAPAATLTGKDRYGKVHPVWIDRQYGEGGGKLNSIEEPLGTLPGVPKANLVQAEGFIVPQNYNNGPVSLEEPMQTITANRKHHFLVNPQFASKGGSIAEPCFTLIARMDKAPPHLITLETGHYAIEIYESDPPIVVKLKEFMAANGIVDIKMRMLRIPELKKIQGFPVEYYLYGTQEDQKLFIGNSVHPDVPKHWYETTARILRNLQIAA